MAAKDVDETQSEEQRENPGPMLDISQAAVKKMIAQAKTKGYITYDELNAALPQDQVSSEQIEDVMSLLSEMGVNVIEAEESADDAEEGEGGEAAKTSDKKEVATTTQESATSNLDRTDDPVRMYLREMGTVELLSREGEIAIAKRIEAGRGT
ncbi:MAG: RNA polymerase sigma factor region1.1 domain-containing protein, partial [Pseudomonadota bacterium]